MAQVPLSLGDFIIAYTSAAEWSHGRSPTSYESKDVDKWLNKAARVGLDELRRIRDSRRLPTGSSVLKAQLVDALRIRYWRKQRGVRIHVPDGTPIEVARRLRHRWRNNPGARCPDPLRRKPSLATRYRSWASSLVRRAFYNDDDLAPRRVGYKGRARRRHHSKAKSYYSTNSALSIHWIVMDKDAPRVSGERDAYNHCGDYELWLRQSWRADVQAHGIANVEGRFVLDATLVSAQDVPHADALYRAQWVECGRGHDLRSQHGLIVVAGDDAMLVAFGGPDGKWLSTKNERAALIKARALARRASYRAHKAASRTGQEGGE